jgi:hypothetical protein
MVASQRGRLPRDLARGQSRFQAWRERRKAGSRIPQPLWTLAARLANKHGVARAATVLGLDYYSLKKRTESAVGPPTSRPAFVELPAPVTVGKQCLCEWVNGAGASLRVQLMGYDTADVEALARSFWNAK